MNDDALLERLQQIAEIELHDRVIVPLLKKLGAANIKNIHGPAEKGKDIIFTRSDGFFDLAKLCVCQVKNAPMSDRDAIATLEQLLQARRTEITNPLTKRKELPQEVYLITTFTLPELSDTHSLLDHVRQECIVIEPRELIAALISHIPQLCDELMEPGAGILQTVRNYVQIHREFLAFDLPESRRISGFFVNLGVAPYDSPIAKALTYLLTEEPTERRPYSGRRVPSVESVRPAQPGRAALKTWLRKRSARSLRVLSERVATSWSVAPPIRIMGAEDEAGAKGNMGDVQVDLSELSPCIKRLGQLTEASRGVRPHEWIGRLDAINRLCECVTREFGPAQWRVVGAAHLRKLTQFGISAVNPADLLGCQESVAIVGGAGAGKTCFARMLTEEATATGVRVVYFPCAQIGGDDTDIRRAIVRFLINEGEGITQSDAIAYLKTADLIVLDGCDEASNFGAALGEEIKRLVLPRRVAVDFSTRDDATQDLELPDDLKDKFEVLPRRGARASLALIAPIASIDFERAIVTNAGTPYAERLKRLRCKALEIQPARLVITSRSVDGLGIGSFCTVVQLQELSDEQLRRFFGRWLSKPMLSKVMQFIDNDKNVRDICRNPMTATIVASLAIRCFELPRSRTEVYKRRFELLLERWDRARNVPDRSSVAAVDKLRFLAELAYRIHVRHGRQFQLREARAVWRSGFGLVALGVPFERFMEELVHVDNAVFKVSGGSFSLGHLSFQEYLAALAMVWGQKVGELVGRYDDPWWHNVMVFFVGITGDASKVLDGVHEEFPLRNSELVQRMLHEARYTPPHVRNIVEEMALEEDAGDDEVWSEDDYDAGNST